MFSFGGALRCSVYGSSHGEAVGVLVDGVPAGLPLAESDFDASLRRRTPGACGTTQRREPDSVRLVSGVYKGMTTGAPVVVEVANCDARSADYDILQGWPRPGHADYVASCKYGGHQDERGGGFFSGRMTVAQVVAGVIAHRLMPNVECTAQVVEVGGQTAPWDSLLEEVIAQGDSVGGVVECVAEGCAVGWGAPYFDTVEGLLAHALFAVPGVTAVEVGCGVGASRMRGSEYNDVLLNAQGERATNHSGGAVGGITQGGALQLRVSFRPAASIAMKQCSFHPAKERMETHRVQGRHDSCFVLRVPVVVESVVYFVLADLWLRSQRDTVYSLGLGELTRNDDAR